MNYTPNKLKSIILNTVFIAIVLPVQATAAEHPYINLIKDINTGSSSSTPHQIVNYNGQAIFQAKEQFGGDIGLWKSDGTEAGTELITNSINYHLFVGGRPVIHAVFKDQLFFSGEGAQDVGPELFVSDGTVAGTSKVKDIKSGEYGSYPEDLTVINADTMLFFASTKDQAKELWRSDGTEAGTAMVKAIDPSYLGGAHCNGFTSGSALLNGIFYFGAKGPGYEVGDLVIGGCELWRSDGTEVGTYLVKDLDPTEHSYGASDAAPSRLITFNNKIVFSANNTKTGRELFQSDGTAEGTTILKDICPNDGAVCADSGRGSKPEDFIVAGNLLFFTAHDATHGRELWISDGTTAGTKMLIDLQLPDNYDYELLVSEQTTFNNMLFFVFDDKKGDNLYGQELWRTDGTAEGTVLVKDIHTNPNDRSGNSSPRNLTVAGDRLYFSAYTPENGRELWQTDGTTEGTRMVQDMYRSSGWGGGITSLSNINGTLFFSSDSYKFLAGESNGVGNELWKVTPSTFNWDIDGNGVIEPLTDGLLVVRYLFGFTDDALIAGVVANNATRSSATKIQAYLQIGKDNSALDIDDNRAIEPLTDGLLLLRYLFGFSGLSLTDGVVGTGALRDNAADLGAYLLKSE